MRINVKKLDKKYYITKSHIVKKGIDRYLSIYYKYSNYYESNYQWISKFKANMVIINNDSIYWAPKYINAEKKFYLICT